ncbi:MAG: hypothetical protein Q8M95_13505 [Candidatus Methanoperedens sp.]|nr:hypothetical protein [Candidatus Methanoperedens sp.]
MKRLLYIPNESLPKISKFLSLDKKSIETLINILMDSEKKSIVDLYLSIMNEMNVSDDDAAAIFSSYKYLLFVLEENNLKFSDLIPETKYILETSKILDYNKINKNVEINSEHFINLFSAGSIEEKFAKKDFLSSETFNSVVDIHSICDIRPFFNEERNEILDFLNSINIEFTVQDSADNIKIIPLSFDDEAFDNLIKEIDNIKKKKEVINKKISKWRKI